MICHWSRVRFRPVARFLPAALGLVAVCSSGCVATRHSTIAINPSATEASAEEGFMAPLIAPAVALALAIALHLQQTGELPTSLEQLKAGNPQLAETLAQLRKVELQPGAEGQWALVGEVRLLESWTPFTVAIRARHDPPEVESLPAGPPERN
jgi:hypothetical protein